MLKKVDQLAIIVLVLAAITVAGTGTGSTPRFTRHRGRIRGRRRILGSSRIAGTAVYGEVTENHR